MRLRQIPGLSVLVILAAALLAACGGQVAAPPTVAPTVAPTIAPTIAPAAGRFDPDNEPDRLNFDQLTERLGPLPAPARPYKIGVVVKFLGNQYWSLLAQGMTDRAAELGVVIDVQSAESEADQLGQLAIMEQMIADGYDALLVSPQTDTNLLPGLEKAAAADILVLNVNDAVLTDARQWVGPNQYENGVRVAQYLLAHMTEGGQVAVIEGQAGVYAAKERTLGFRTTLEGSNLEVVASVPGDWDATKAGEAALAILAQYPDLKAIYCNNDIMALGVVEALKTAGKAEGILVVGTDGIDAAYEAVRSGDLAGTVDSFPYRTGQAAVEVALRLLEGQAVPRAVYSPQNLIIDENVDQPDLQRP